jgi:hypothetical protein
VKATYKNGGFVEIKSYVVSVLIEVPRQEQG